MTEDEKLVVFEQWKRDHIFRHGQRGYYSLAELPRRPDIARVAFSTGWWELDQIFRFYPGQFTVLTGIAGHGKSTLMLNIVCNLARAGIPSFLYVPENEQHLAAKMRKIWNDDTNFDDLCQQYCFVQSSETEDGKIHDLMWVCEQAMIAIKRDGVELIVIDPWNELERAKPRDLLLTDYIAECLILLKYFCRSQNAAVVVIAHPTKAIVESGRERTPRLSDIEGSMSWFNKCDNGLIVVREDTGTTKVISAKAREREAGRRGQCWFQFDPTTEIFTPQYGAAT